MLSAYHVEETLIKIENVIQSKIKSECSNWISNNLATIECDHYSPKSCTTKKEDLFCILLTVKGNPGFQLPLGLF